MKKIKVICLFSICCILLLSSACVNKSPENLVTPESETAQSSEIVSEPSLEELEELPEKYKKYEDILSYLEEEKYDDAITIINEKKNEALKEKYGEIEEYLVTIELTPDNFDEYFEFVKDRSKNAFGEDGNIVSVG